MFKRDEIRENMYHAEYGIKPEISLCYTLNPDDTFKEIVIKFKYKDKEYILDEYYEGTTNKTDVVKLIYDGITESFRNPRGAFNDAEKRLVELMKNG